MADTLVECYSGHTYAQEPRAVHWHGHRYLVVHVAGRWRTPEGSAFQVETETGILFEVHYRESEERWTIQPLSGLEQLLEHQRSLDQGKDIAFAPSAPANRTQMRAADHTSPRNENEDKEVQI